MRMLTSVDVAGTPRVPSAPKACETRTGSAEIGQHRRLRHMACACYGAAIVGWTAMALLLGGCSAGEKPGESKTAHERREVKKDRAATAKVAAESPERTAGPTDADAREASPKRETKKETPDEKLTKDIEQMAAEKPRDLGLPLVDHPDNLRRLDPNQPVWINVPDKQVVLQGEVCKAGYPLEFFATYGNRSYEAVVAVNVKPSIVHAGLLAIGAKPGHPAKFQPEFSPPTGTEVAIEIRWKDADGKLQSVPAQHWIRNIKTRKELDMNWVFAGSAFVTDKETGANYYQADSGELICVLSLPNAMLDLPVQGYGAIEARTYEAFEEHLPPQGTPITIVLKPVLSGKSDHTGTGIRPSEKAVAGDLSHRAEYEAKAVEVAEPWLALSDRDEFSKCWETSSELLRNYAERREFVRKMSDARKPFGKVLTRQLESKQYFTSVPGVPDGHYVVLTYKTSFEHKASAAEVITPMLDKDKKWRVSGYYVR